MRPVITSNPVQASTLQPFVDRLALRSRLTEPERQVLLALPFQLVDLPSGRDLISTDPDAAFSYFIHAGLIGRFSTLRDGIRQIVSLHIAGDMANLCSLVLPRTSWTFHALMPTVVLRVAHTDLIETAKRYPDIAMAFWRDCVVDAAVISEWLLGIARRSSDARLAHLLCELYCRYDQAGKVTCAGSFPFPVTQARMSEILGITGIHVNRMVKTLRERGLVTIERAGVVIHDWPGLVRLAEFDPAYLHLKNEMSRSPC